MKRNAQLVSLEIILTLIIFLALVVGAYSFYSYLVTDYVLSNEQIERDEIFTSAYTQLTVTNGYPRYWDTLNLSVEKPKYIGLRTSDGTFSIDKILFIADQNDTYYDFFKVNLGFIDADSDISLKYYLFNGSTFVENTTLEFGVTKSTYRNRLVRNHFFTSGTESYLLKMEAYYE